MQHLLVVDVMGLTSIWLKLWMQESMCIVEELSL